MRQKYFILRKQTRTRRARSNWVGIHNFLSKSSVFLKEFTQDFKNYIAILKVFPTQFPNLLKFIVRSHQTLEINSSPDNAIFIYKVLLFTSIQEKKTHER